MTTPTIRNRVFDTIPGYHDAKSVIKNSLSVSKPLPFDVKNARASVFTQVHDALVAGDPIPDTVADELAAIDNAQQARAAVNRLFDEVVNAAHQTLEFAVPVDDPAAYRILDTELQTLVKRVHTLVPDLAGATTATEAVANGNAATDAWREINALTETYDEIRTVQVEIIPREMNFWDRVLTAGLYRDALAVHPFFATRRLKNDRDPESNSILSAAPVSGESTWWPADVDRPTGLLRIVTTTTPWVPNPSVMNEIFTLALSAVANINLDDPREERHRRIAAHDEYLARL